MKQLILFFILCVAAPQAIAQTADAQPAQEQNDTDSVSNGPRHRLGTKYDSFLKAIGYGTFTQYFDYKTPHKLNVRWFSDPIFCKIRIFVDINTGKKTAFFIFHNGNRYRYLYEEAIAPDDLAKLVDAISVLRREALTIPDKDVYMETEFITEDGFKIGFYKENRSNMTNWFMSFNDRTVFLKGNVDFEVVFTSALQKIEELLSE